MNTFFEVIHSKEDHAELINLLEVQFVRCSFNDPHEDEYKAHIAFINGAHQEVWFSYGSYVAFVKALQEVNEIE